MVADNFKFGADKNIIVALEHDVLMAKKKDLTKVSPYSRFVLTSADALFPGIGGAHGHTPTEIAGITQYSCRQSILKILLMNYCCTSLDYFRLQI